MACNKPVEANDIILVKSNYKSLLGIHKVLKIHKNYIQCTDYIKLRQDDNGFIHSYGEDRYRFNSHTYNIATPELLTEFCHDPELIRYMKINHPKRMLLIDKCRMCYEHNFDDNNVVERYGKSWCEKLDREIDPEKIPDDCPMPKYE